MTREFGDLQLQRLVDGALDDKQRRDVLATLDDHPQWWREVALAFIEEQIWSDVLGPRADDQPMANRSVSGDRSNAPRARRIQGLVILAACLLLMLVAGIRVGRWSAGTELASDGDWTLIDERPLRTEEDEDRSGFDLRQPIPLHNPDRLRLVYGDGPSRESVEVPVYDQSQLAGKTWQGPQIIDIERVNRELESLGYRIDWQTQYLGGDLSDGRTLVVPVRAVSLQYRGQ